MPLQVALNIESERTHPVKEKKERRHTENVRERYAPVPIMLASKSRENKQLH